MTNPWLKKNPWLSLWLSAANRAGAMTRGAATAEAHRQAGRMIAESQRQMLQFWAVEMTGSARRGERSR